MPILGARGNLIILLVLPALYYSELFLQDAWICFHIKWNSFYSFFLSVHLKVNRCLKKNVNYHTCDGNMIGFKCMDLEKTNMSLDVIPSHVSSSRGTCNLAPHFPCLQTRIIPTSEVHVRMRRLNICVKFLT